MNSFWVLASLGALDLQEIYAQGNLQPKGCWEKATLFSNKPAGFHCALIQSSDFRDSGGLWVLLFGQWPFIDCAGFYWRHTLFLHFVCFHFHPLVLVILSLFRTRKTHCFPLWYHSAWAQWHCFYRCWEVPHSAPMEDPWEWWRLSTRTAEHHLCFRADAPLWCSRPEAHIAVCGHLPHSSDRCPLPQLALSFQREVVFREEFQLNPNFWTVVELVHYACSFLILLFLSREQKSCCVNFSVTLIWILAD